MVGAACTLAALLEGVVVDFKVGMLNWRLHSGRMDVSRSVVPSGRFDLWMVAVPGLLLGALMSAAAVVA